jgi:tetratricopeptide (TPR) repeat protein
MHISKPALWLSALVLLAPMSALAGSTCPADSAAKARIFYEEGAKRYRLGDLAAAVEQFKQAYLICPSPKLLYNLGQAYRQLKDNEKAIYFYKQFMSATAPDDPQKAEVEKMIAQLQAQQSPKTEPPPPPVASPAVSAPAPTPAPPRADLVASAPRSEDRRPLAKRGWFWGAVIGSAAAVGLAVGLGVGLGSPKDPSPTYGTIVKN